MSSKSDRRMPQDAAASYGDVDSIGKSLLTDSEEENLVPVITESVHHEAPVVPTEARVTMPNIIPASLKPTMCKLAPKRSTIKMFINILIAIAVLVLLGVVVYLTCVRYRLVGDAMTTGNNTMAMALLSPEITGMATGLATAL